MMIRWIDSLNIEYAKNIQYERRLPEAIEIMAGHLYRTKNQTGTIRYASALIVLERKRLQKYIKSDKYRMTEKLLDDPNAKLAEALEYVASANNTADLLIKIQFLRHAESQLRSLWKQQHKEYVNWNE